MAQITINGKPFNTNGELPPLGEVAPDFELVKRDLTKARLTDFKGEKKILNIFPSIDTSICSSTVKTFNEKIKAFPQILVLNISKDLPFAQKRFYDTHKVEVENFIGLSAFKSSFAEDYGVEIVDSPLAGLCARAVILLGEKNQVIYSQLINNIAMEPNYQEIFQKIKEF